MARLLRGVNANAVPNSIKKPCSSRALFPAQFQGVTTGSPGGVGSGVGEGVRLGGGVGDGLGVGDGVPPALVAGTLADFFGLLSKLSNGTSIVRYLGWMEWTAIHLKNLSAFERTKSRLVIESALRQPGCGQQFRTVEFVREHFAIGHAAREQVKMPALRAHGRIDLRAALRQEKAGMPEVPADCRELLHFRIVLPDGLAAFVNDQVATRVRPEKLHKLRRIGRAEIRVPFRIIHRIEHTDAFSRFAKERRKLLGQRRFAGFGLAED